MQSRNIIMLALSAAVGAAVAGPAQAQSADQDVRCILVGNVFGATEKDPVRKQLAFATALFFAGRADARLAPAQLKTLIAAQGKAVTAATAPAVMTECAKQFQAKERAMQVIGQEVARAQAPHPTPVPTAPAKK